MEQVTVCEHAEFAAQFHAGKLLAHCFRYIAKNKCDPQLLSIELQNHYKSFVADQLKSLDSDRQNFVRLPDSSRLPRRLPVQNNANANAAINNAPAQPPHQLHHSTLRFILLAPMLVLCLFFAAIVYFDIVGTRSRWSKSFNEL